jgi:TonB family protein
MKFCLDDGSLLAEELAPTRPGSDAEATLHLPPPAPTAPARGRIPTQPSTMTSMGYQPVAGAYPGSQLEPERSPSRAWLWVIVALIIGVSGIVIALIVMRGRQQDLAAASPTPTSIASPSPTVNGSPTTSFNNPSDTSNNGQLNRQTEKATPLPKATPLTKPTPANPQVKEEQPTPRPAPHAPISGGVLNGRAVRLVQPPYPPIARSAHASGQVIVQVLIDENGNVISAHATSGNPLLQSSAINAARASKFSPTMLSGQPVKVSGVIVYNFVAQ